MNPSSTVTDDDPQSARRNGGITRTVNAGFAHHQAGRLERAEALYRKALARDPEHAEALHLLGVVAYQRGDSDAAIRLIEHALPQLQDFPEAHLNLGNALREAGRLAEAADCYRRAVALDPGYGMGHCNLARALNDQGNFEAGLESARRAVELIPDFLGAHINLAAALSGLRRFAEAEAPLRRALDLVPNHAALHSQLGRVLTELRQFDEASACYERALALNPNDPVTRIAFGRTRLSAQDPKGAETSFRHALSLQPKSASALQLLGDAIAHQGRFEEASACYKRALDVDPDFPEAYYTLALTGQQARHAAPLARLKAALLNSDRQMSDRIAAGFALGTLFDNAERCDEAFPCFTKANSLQRQQWAKLGRCFDPDALQKGVQRLTTVFTPSLFSALKGRGNGSQLPVFVVGMPRSGTSLVEQIAASHSQVFGAGELWDFHRIVDGGRASREYGPSEQFDPDLARRFADRYLEHLQTIGKGATRVIDKMPANIFYLGLVSVLFTAARIILCRRDPRDTCLSCYFHRFSEGHVYSCDLMDCGRQFLELERLTTHWLGVLPLEILVVDYEKLVADPEGESRRLIEFLGLDWEPSCLEFHKTERPVLTTSFWQVRQPLFTRSVGRWRKYERHLGPLLSVLASGKADRAAE